MNVQLILVQAGVELAREVLSSPVTKRLLAQAICRFTNGSLCPTQYDLEKGEWKTKGGQKPDLIIHASDENGDESTLSCGMDLASVIALRAMNWLDTLLVRQSDQLLRFAADPTDMGETLSVANAYSANQPLTTLEEFEAFVVDELSEATRDH